MTDEEISNLTTIDAFIQRKQPFAVYRIPGEKVPRLLTQAEGEVRLIYDLKELNGQRGFVIAPFQVSEPENRSVSVFADLPESVREKFQRQRV